MTSSDKLTSYSQLGEDRILAHLFKHRGTPGFYIDAGAFHPFRYSNTALLHDLGWSGINIDLSPHSVDLIRKSRPNDVTLHAAIGDSTGEINCYLFGEGPSTIHTADFATAELWKKKFKKDYFIQKVPTTTLNKVIEQHSNNRKIDFLNIDIEGFEMACLRGLDVKTHTPSVIAIEIHANSIEDLIQTDVYQHLRNFGYRCAAYSIITAIFTK